MQAQNSDNEQYLTIRKCQLNVVVALAGIFGTLWHLHEFTWDFPMSDARLVNCLISIMAHRGEAVGSVGADCWAQAANC